jgi:hypothetical protein
LATVESPASQSVTGSVTVTGKSLVAGFQHLVLDPTARRLRQVLGNLMAIDPSAVKPGSERKDVPDY